MSQTGLSSKNSKTKIRRGSRVRVISGDSKGAEGVVLSIDRRAFRATVDGVNPAVRHKKPNRQGDEGGRVSIFLPIHLSNLKLLSNDIG